MTFRIWLALLLALAARADEPFFFIQGTDPQLGMWAENRDTARETANLEFFIATANRLKPAFVVMTGDLVNRRGDPGQIAEYRRITGKLDASIKLYNVPGNHDAGDEPAPASLAAWRNTFGPDYYSFRVGSTAFVVLDSALIQAPQRAPGEEEKQEAWLRAELVKLKHAGAARIIVFQHHPWFLLTPEEPDQYFNLPRAARKLFLPLFKQYGVTHVFAGHFHINAEARDGPLDLVTTGPLGKPRGAERSGFRVVIVRDSVVEHKYYDFGSVPNRIVDRRP